MKKVIIVLFTIIVLGVGTGTVAYAQEGDTVVDVNTDTLDKIQEEDDSSTEDASATEDAQATEDTLTKTDITDSSAAGKDGSFDLSSGVFNGQEVTKEGFFSKVMNRLNDSLSGIQKVAVFIIAICFVVCMVLAVASGITGNVKKIWVYILSALLCLIMIVCIIYARDIISSFNSWFMS